MRDLRADFDYLGADNIYLDSACQSLRPRPVIEALNDYYTTYGTCGERVKYAWGVKVDEGVERTRQLVLDYLKLRPKDYFVSFTLNTTYGINLILSQLREGLVDKVVTSDIEHNSPFLATITFAKSYGVPREVLTRRDDGSIDLEAADFTRALVVVNCASNVDGRRLDNIRELTDKVHKQGGYIIIDAAQAMTTNSDLLEKTEVDAICFSAHKMYAPSLGVMVVRRDFAPKLQTTFIGGGMVDDVPKVDEYVLSADSAEHIYTKFEAGLQAWGEIIALGKAIEWLSEAKKSSQVSALSAKLMDGLKQIPTITVVNFTTTPTIAWYSDKLDAHLLAEALSDAGIMVRSGYFCCHYYLDQVKHYPPLIRMSVALHNTEADIDKVLEVLRRIFK
jgi:cysteine desulfurase/selenocysteine lyase